jgi:hypothetical protein
LGFPRIGLKQIKDAEIDVVESSVVLHNNRILPLIHGVLTD